MEHKQAASTIQRFVRAHQEREKFKALSKPGSLARWLRESRSVSEEARGC